MIKAIAIDDEPLALTIIQHFCNENESIQLLKTFTNQNEALLYLATESVDLIFLDIQMPQKNGIDFYKELELTNKPSVIFTTAYEQYALQGFEVDAIDYLVKPIEEERFQKAIEKAQRMILSNNSSAVEDHFMIRADYKNNKIFYKDILYIEGLDDYIQIHLDNKPKIVARMSMKNMVEKLPEDQFVRIHRSYIVPIQRINSTDSKNIYIDNQLFPIGETYKNEVNVKLNKK